MVYVPCVTSPVTTDLFRSLGATEFHFGLLGGLPPMMVLFQFLGALWSNHMRQRRPWFMRLVIAGRLLYLPVALVPMLPGFPREAVVPTLIGLIALSTGLQTLSYPMWLSWMGDLIPRRILNRYWGGRQRYTTLAMSVTTLAITAFTYYAHGVAVQPLFLVLAIIGCTAGTIDILLFKTIREPANVLMVGSPWATLRQPLRDHNCRKLLRFQAIFYGVSNVGAAFMLVYTLEVLEVPLWKTALLWSLPSFGYALVAPLWGRLADRFGHRPVLRLCVALKPGIALAYLLVTPATALPVLGVAMFLDSMLNAGIEIASNGYVLKMAPRANRSMFIAMTSAFSSFAMGVGAILGGVFLQHTTGMTWLFAGREWNHFQLLFLVSFLLRIPCIRLAGLVREPASAKSRVVLEYLLGLWPMRALLLPMDWYRRRR
jgi:MFS family permease